MTSEDFPPRSISIAHLPGEQVVAPTTTRSDQPDFHFRADMASYMEDPATTLVIPVITRPDMHEFGRRIGKSTKVFGRVFYAALARCAPDDKILGVLPEHPANRRNTRAVEWGLKVVSIHDLKASNFPSRQYNDTYVELFNVFYDALLATDGSEK